MTIVLGPSPGRLAAVAAAATAVPPLLLIATASRPLWLDEAASATMAALPDRSFRRVLLEREGNGMLHTLLLRAWSEVMPGDLGLRVPSVLAGVTAVLLLAAIATRLLDRRSALLVPPLLVTNPVFVRYVVEARSYALVLALSCASGLLLVRAVRSPSTGRWLAYAAVSGLAAYAQYFALLMVASHVVALLLLRGSAVRLRPHLLPAAALYGLVISGVPRLMTDDAAAGVGYLSGSPLMKVLPLLSAAGVTAVAALAAVLVLRRPKGSRLTLGVDPDRWPLVLLLCWCVVPVILAVVLSVVRTPVLAPRYFTICVPAAVMILALGLSRLPVRAAVPVLGVTCLAGLALGVQWIERHTEDWDEVALHIASTTGSRDRVLFVAPYVRLAHDRYRPPQTQAQPAYPNLPWGADPADLFFATPMPQESVRISVSGAPNVLLVVSHVSVYGTDDPAYTAVTGALSGGFRLTGERSFRGAVVQRWSSISP